MLRQLGTVPNVAREGRKTPYGATPLGDRVFWLRIVSGRGSQERVADEAGLKRLNYLALESGRNKGTAVELIQSLAQFYSKSTDEFMGYLNGEFGEPSRKAAEEFLGDTRTADLPPEYLKALGWLEITHGRDFTAAAIEVSRRAHMSRDRPTIERLAAEIYEAAAAAKGKSTVVGREVVDDVPLGMAALKKKGSRKK